MHVFIYIYTHVFTCIHIYIYTHACICKLILILYIYIIIHTYIHATGVSCLAPAAPAQAGDRHHGETAEGARNFYPCVPALHQKRYRNVGSN